MRWEKGGDDGESLHCLIKETESGSVIGTCSELFYGPRAPRIITNIMIVAVCSILHYSEYHTPVHGEIW